MDDLEFRRNVIAEPKSKDTALLKAAKQDPAKQEFLSQMRQFDDKIADALKVDVPDNLAQQLILRQAFTEHKQAKKRFKVNLALAASVVVVIGLSIQLFNPLSHSPASLGAHSIGHLMNEYEYFEQAKENNSLAQVNAKLVRFGGQFTSQSVDILGKAVFANYCDFDGVTSLHLIYDSPQGRMSVFVTPPNTTINFEADFDNEQYIGKGLKFAKAHISVVGHRRTNAQLHNQVSAFSQKVAESIEWKI